MRIARATPLALALVFAVACGDDAAVEDTGPPNADAGVDAADGAPDSGALVLSPPQSATLPRLTPCAPGWREVEGSEGVTLCEPWPESGRVMCTSAAEAHLPGGIGCVVLGSSCSSGRFADGLPAGTIYVDPMAAAGGDGTIATPYRTIGEAVAAAESGGTIALSRGDHLGGISVDITGIGFVGACADQTRIIAPAPTEEVPTLTITSDIGMTGLTVSGAAPAIDVADDAGLTLEGVVIQDAAVTGIRIGDGARVEGEDVAIRGTTADAAGMRGYGIDLRAGSLSLRRAELAENTTRAIYAQGTGATLALEDALIRDTRSRPMDSNLGGALDVFGGVAVRFTRTVFENNRDKNIRVDSAGTTLDMEDCVVRGGQPRESDDFFGFGIGVASGSSATIRRTLFENNRTIGVATQQPDTELALSDVVIRDTGANLADGMLGTGLDVQSGAHLVANRVLVVRGTGFGARISGEASRVEVNDLTIADTQPQISDGTGGFGLAVVSSTMTGQRVRLTRNRLLHLIVIDAGDVTFQDVEMTEGLSEEASGLMGGGVLTGEGGRVVLNRALLSDLHAVALWATTRGEISATDLQISRVAPADCIDGGCADNPGGFGAVSTADAMLSLRRFVVEDAALCGVSVGRASGLFVEEGWIRQSNIGINVQNPDVDLEVLQREILFSDNARNLDSSVIQPPSMSSLGF